MNSGVILFICQFLTLIQMFIKLKMNKFEVILKALASILYGVFCFFILLLVKYSLHETIEKLTHSLCLADFSIFAIMFFLSAFMASLKAPSNLKYIWTAFLFQLVIGIFISMLWITNPISKKYSFYNMWLYYILLNLAWFPFTLLGVYLGIKIKGKIKKRKQ